MEYKNLNKLINHLTKKFQIDGFEKPDQEGCNYYVETLYEMFNKQEWNTELERGAIINQEEENKKTNFEFANDKSNIVNIEFEIGDCCGKCFIDFKYDASTDQSTILNLRFLTFTEWKFA